MTTIIAECCEEARTGSPRPVATVLPAIHSALRDSLCVACASGTADRNTQTFPNRCVTPHRLSSAAALFRGCGAQLFQRPVFQADLVRFRQLPELVHRPDLHLTDTLFGDPELRTEVP